MRRLKILGLALMAVFALSVVASASASAEELSFLPEPTAANPVTLEGTSGKGTLETVGKSTVTCTSVTSLASLTGLKVGTYHLHFKGCKSSGAPCNSVGDEKEVILALGKTKLVYDKVTEGLAAAILLEQEELHFTCTLGPIKVLVLVRGNLLGLIKPINVLTKTLELVVEQEKGKPKETKYWETETGEPKTAKLETNVNETKFEESGDGSEKNEITKIKQGGAAVEALVMA